MVERPTSDAGGSRGTEPVEQLEPPAANPTAAYDDRRCGAALRLVVGVRPISREALARHRIGTVGEAIERGPWLDEVIGEQQAERIRQYARGE